MKLALDKYAHLQSPIHRWEPRTKLVALLALIFAFALVREVILLPAMIGVTAVLFWLSRLPLPFLLSRLRYPGMFIAAVVVLLPFVAGETVLFRLGELTIRQEGGLEALSIATRMGCILTVSLILFGTAPFVTTIKALQSLGLPRVLIDMTLLSYRYLEQLGEMRTIMQQAMRLRGFRSDRFSRRNLNRLAGLAGSLLVRSYEQSERVYRAMILRGYGQRLSSSSRWKIGVGDAIAAGVVLLVAAGFAIAESIGFYS